MLSIVISSYNEKLYGQLEKSICQTIGKIEYELVQIWNPNRMGICTAYNLGAERAKYPNLLFLHEDVVFDTNSWGEKLLSHLSMPKVGTIGLAGGRYKSRYASSWSEFEEFRVKSIIQEYKYSQKESIYQCEGKEKHLYKEVVVLDGVFIACKKKVWQSIRFDDKMLKGFHGYDIDFSLSVSDYYHNYVVFDILLKHFSEGKPDKNWFKDAHSIAVKHQKKLPKIIASRAENIEQLEKRALKKYIKKCKKYKYSMFITFFYLVQFSGWKSILSIRKIKYNLQVLLKVYK